MNVHHTFFSCAWPLYCMHIIIMWSLHVCLNIVLFSLLGMFNLHVLFSHIIFILQMIMWLGNEWSSGQWIPWGELQLMCCLKVAAQTSWNSKKGMCQPSVLSWFVIPPNSSEIGINCKGDSMKRSCCGRHAKFSLFFLCVSDLPRWKWTRYDAGRTQNKIKAVVDVEFCMQPSAFCSALYGNAP